jgi:fluoride exporter
VSAAWVWIGAGALGAIGSLARFLLDGFISRRAPGDLPWGTLTVNVIGAFAIGIVVGTGVPGDERFLLAGGLIASFTTFSTWMFETHRLGEDGQERAALANLVVMVALGIAAVALGWWIGALL